MRSFQKSVTASILLSGIFLTPIANADSTFTDVAASAWYAPAVEELSGLNIVSGYSDKNGKSLGLFKPDGNVTVAEMLKMGILASTWTVPTSGIPANASAKNDWSAMYVSAAEQMHVALLKDTTVDVHRNATRGEVVQTFLTLFKIPLQEPQAGMFTDVTASSPFLTAITTATELGIVKGDTDASGNSTGTFRPNDPINRAEVSIILSKLLAQNPSSRSPIVFASSSSQMTVLSSSVTSTASSATSVALSQSSTSPMPAGQTYRVAVSSVNVRVEPSMTGRVLRSLQMGDTVTLVNNVDDVWAEVMMSDGSKGFVAFSALSATSIRGKVVATGMVNATVNVHASADASSSVIGSISENSVVKILDNTTDYWLHVVLPDGREGYIASKFVNVSQ